MAGGQRRERVANNRMRGMVIGQVPFTNANGTVFGEWHEDPRCYVVYSYGFHFPMYVWMEGQWYGNESSYSRTTSKHQSQCRPLYGKQITWLKTDALTALIEGKQWCQPHESEDEHDMCQVQHGD